MCRCGAWMPGRLAPLAIVAGVALNAQSPLSVKDKFEQYASHAYNPLTVPAAALMAGVDQWRDRPEGWGQGASGWGQRGVSRYGRFIIKDTIRFGADVSLGLDSHYRASDSRRVGGRIRHALAQTVIAYDGSGRATLGLPRILGAYGSGFLSNTWYPDGERSAVHALRRGSYSLLFDLPRNVFYEFWPDLKRWLRRR